MSRATSSAASHARCAQRNASISTLFLPPPVLEEPRSTASSIGALVVGELEREDGGTAALATPTSRQARV
jgi:hypothetical protein